MNCDADRQYFMQLALQQAMSRRGFCSPNPAVGAVVVNMDGVVAQGAHHAAGEPHAEVVALRAAADQARGATLYVTLEPCCHYGRTPPCTQAILDAGIVQVIFSYYDPNERVSGQGQSDLRQAGIACVYFPCDSVTEFYRSYHYWVRNKTPWITVKLAMTAQGGVADAQYRPMCISGQSANRLTHQSRLQSDAILTSVRTVLADDPQMNARLHQQAVSKAVFVIDPCLKLPLSARVIQTAQPLMVLCQPHASQQKKLELERHGVICTEVPLAMNGKIDLVEVMRMIGAHGAHDLWVEVGPTLFKALHSQGLVNETILYLSKKRTSGLLYRANELPVNGDGMPCDLIWEDAGDDAIARWRRTL